MPPQNKIGLPLIAPPPPKKKIVCLLIAPQKIGLPLIAPKKLVPGAATVGLRFHGNKVKYVYRVLASVHLFVFVFTVYNILSYL